MPSTRRSSRTSWPTRSLRPSQRRPTSPGPAATSCSTPSAITLRWPRPSSRASRRRPRPRAEWPAPPRIGRRAPARHIGTGTLRDPGSSSTLSADRGKSHDQRSQGASALPRGAVAGPPARPHVRSPRDGPRRPVSLPRFVHANRRTLRPRHATPALARVSHPPGPAASQTGLEGHEGASRRRTRLATATASLRSRPDRRVTRRLRSHGSPRPAETGRWEVESSRASGGCPPPTCQNPPNQSHCRRTGIYYWMPDPRSGGHLNADAWAASRQRCLHLPGRCRHPVVDAGVVVE